MDAAIVSFAYPEDYVVSPPPETASEALAFGD